MPLKICLGGVEETTAEYFSRQVNDTTIKVYTGGTSESKTSAKQLTEAEVSQKATVTKKAIDYRRRSYQFTTRRKWQEKYCVN